MQHFGAPLEDRASKSCELLGSSESPRPGETHPELLASTRGEEPREEDPAGEDWAKQFLDSCEPTDQQKTCHRHVMPSHTHTHTHADCNDLFSLMTQDRESFIAYLI